MAFYLKNIVCFIDNNEFTIQVDMDNKLKYLNHMIALRHSLNLNEFDVIYKNKSINSDFEKQLKYIFKHDKNPVILYEKRNLNKETDFDMKRLEKTKLREIIDKKNLRHKVIISNFTSRTEILKFINLFLQINHVENDYLIQNNQSTIEISFKFKEISENFIFSLLKEKNVNQVYSKINIIKDSSNLTNNLISESFSNCNTEKNDISLNQSNTTNQSYLDSSIVNMCRLNKNRLELLKKYNADIFISSEERRMKEIKNSKLKWISNDFRSYSKISNNQIKNYVNLGVFSDSPMNHKFRQINKSKWKGTSNFH